MQILTAEIEVKNWFFRRIFGIICAFTFNFFFLPGWKSNPVQISGERFLNRLALILGSKEIEEINIERREVRTFRKNPQRAIRLFGKFVWLSLKHLLFSRGVEREWRNSHKELVSKDFWEKYLQLNAN
jgi:hypothetical protein